MSHESVSGSGRGSVPSNRPGRKEEANVGVSNRGSIKIGYD